MNDTERAQERRAVPRIATRHALLTYVKTGFFARLFGAKGSDRPLPIRNISTKGVAFLCDEQLKARQALRLSVRCRSDGPRFEAGASVVWCGPGKGQYPFVVGACFTQYGQEARQILAAIEKHVIVRTESDPDSQVLREPGG